VSDDFICSIKMTAAPRFDALLCEVAAGILRQARYSPAAISEILAAFRASLADHAADGLRKCDAVFRREGGQLVIDVAYAGGRQWRLTRPLPSPD
jgi:hypothetical protein